MLQRVCALLRMTPPIILNRGLLFHTAASVPADDSDGYQTGCIFQHTGATGTSRVVYLNEGTVKACAFRAIEAGDFGEFASLESGSGIPLSSSDTANLAVFGDDNELAIASSVYNLRTRLLLTVDQDGASIRALMAQLKLADGVDVSTGVYTASQGYVELAGNTSVEAFAQFSCFDASLEVGAGNTLTVDADGKCAGIYVETTGTGTITNNGQCAAVIVTKATGAPSWPTGIAVDGSACEHGILVGSTSDGEGITLGTTVTKAVGIYAELETDCGSGYNVRPLRTRLRVDVGGNVEAETYGIQGQLNIYSSNLGHWHAGILGTIERSAGTAKVYNPLAGASAIIGRCDEAFTVDLVSFLSSFVALSNATVTLTSGEYVGLYITKTAGKSNFSRGIYIDGSAVDYGIMVGEHSNTVGNGVTVSNTNKRCAGFFADDNAVGTGGAEFISVLRGRLLMTGSTYLGEQYGLHGTVVYRPAASAAISSWTAGVLGTLEGATGMSVAGYAAAILGRVGFGAMQPAVAGFVAGVFALNNMAAELASGSTSAFLADTVGTVEWTYGLNVQSAATAGVLIASTVTTGISVTGTTGTGISLPACTTVGISITGGTAAGHAILVGTSSTGVQVDGTPDYAVEVYADIPTGAQSLANVGAFNCRTTIAAASDITSGSHTVASYHRLEIKGGSTDLGYGWYNAVLGYLKNPSGSVDATQSAIGAVLGLVNVGADWNAQSEAINAAVVAGTYSPNTADIRKYYGFYVWRGGTLAFTHGMYVEAASCTTAIGVGGATNLLSLPVAGTDPVVASVDNGDGEGSIKILVNGVTKYLKYWADPTS